MSSKRDPMIDIRALTTFGEAGTALLDTLTSSPDVRYMVDTDDMSARISWPVDAVFAVDPITILGTLAMGIDTARKYNDTGMWERTWNHVELTHMIREVTDGGREFYVTTYAIVPDNHA